MSTEYIPIKKEEAYELFLNDESFLNDLWHSLGATDRVQTLELAGFDLYKEYAKYQDLNNIHD